MPDLDNGYAVTQAIIEDIEVLEAEKDLDLWVVRAAGIISIFKDMLIAYQSKECGITGRAFSTGAEGNA